MIIRFGLKRTYILFWGIRKIAAGFVLLTPFLLSRFGIRGRFCLRVGDRPGIRRVAGHW